MGWRGRGMTTFYNTETTVRLVPLHCSECGVPFALSKSYVQRRQDDHATFYCPNGHAQHCPGMNREERLAEQLEASRSVAHRERERREHAERQRAAARGQ